MGKRTILLLAAILLCTSTCVGCQKTPAPSGKESDTAPSADSESTTETEGDGELLPQIPEGLRFDGETFTCLTTGPGDELGEEWKSYDVWTEGVTGDAINDAVYARNLYLLDTYGVTIAEIQSKKSTLEEARQDVRSGGGTYNAVFGSIVYCTMLGQQGCSLDLQRMPYVDLTQPWWDQRAVEDLSLLGSVYAATGDITVLDNDATWVLMFNKQMREDLHLEDFYELVRQNAWDFDTFYGMLQKASSDLNGDGERNWKNDRFGMCTSDNTCQGLFYASGEKLVEKDAEGMPVLRSSTERMASVVSMAGKIMSDRAAVYNWSRDGGSSAEMRMVFQDGRGLFYGEVMQCIVRMRDSETDFGVLPWPKYDASQDRYYNFVHAGAGKMVSVPVGQKNTEMVGAILEAMAAKSMYTLTPAYYETNMTYRYIRDKESSEMLDIILDSRCYDLGYIYNWGKLYASIRTVISRGTDAFASTWQKCLPAFETAMQTTMDEYAQLASRE